MEKAWKHLAETIDMWVGKLTPYPATAQTFEAISGNVAHYEDKQSLFTLSHK